LNKCNGITPTGYRVLIEPDTVAEEVTESGIVIPDEFREQYQNAQKTGVLKARGPEAWTDKNRKPWAGIGDRVVFDKYKGIILNGEDGTEYRLLNDTDIMAVVAKDIKLGQLERRSRYER